MSEYNIHRIYNVGNQLVATIATRMVIKSELDSSLDILAVGIDGGTTNNQSQLAISRAMRLSGPVGLTKKRKSRWTWFFTDSKAT